MDMTERVCICVYDIQYIGLKAWDILRLSVSVDEILVPSHFIQLSVYFFNHFLPKGKTVTSYQSIHTSPVCLLTN